MGEQDQIYIVGRLTLQASDLKRKYAFVNAELENVVKAFDALVQSLRPMVGVARIIHPGGSRNKVDIQEYVKKYADISKVLDLIDEQDRLWREGEEIRAKLAELGA